MNSMSVHSLIDKFSGDDRAPLPRSRSGPPAHELERAPQTPLTFKRDIPKFSKPDITLPSTDHSDLRLDPALLALLGPNVTSFPLSETAFIEALRLRAEEERTKQEQLRSDTAAKNLAIMETALRNNVPPHLIPSIMVTEHARTASEQTRTASGSVPLASSTSAGANMTPHMAAATPSMPSMPTHSRHHSGPVGNVRPMGRSHSIGNTASMTNITNMSNMTNTTNIMNPNMPTNLPMRSMESNTARVDPPGVLGTPAPIPLARYDTDNASIVPPINYRFGGKLVAPPRRARSPAKVGAAAVANLEAPTTPLRRHQRHMSMPADTITPRERRTRGALQSPMGATSSIQVRPSPAMPLHRQTRNSQVPSQESMTSFQHVIQFHHWRPEGEDGAASSELLARSLFSHKRLKSSDMAVDVREGDDQDVDVSMASDTTVTEKDPPARFPHDILLSNR